MVPRAIAISAKEICRVWDRIARFRPNGRKLTLSAASKRPLFASHHPTLARRLAAWKMSAPGPLADLPVSSGFGSQRLSRDRAVCRRGSATPINSAARAEPPTYPPRLRRAYSAAACIGEGAHPETSRARCRHCSWSGSWMVASASRTGSGPALQPAADLGRRSLRVPPPTRPQRVEKASRRGAGWRRMQ